MLTRLRGLLLGGSLLGMLTGCDFGTVLNEVDRVLLGYECEECYEETVWVEEPYYVDTHDEVWVEDVWFDEYYVEEPVSEVLYYEDECLDCDENDWWYEDEYYYDDPGYWPDEDEYYYEDWDDEWYAGYWF